MLKRRRARESHVHLKIFRSIAVSGFAVLVVAPAAVTILAAGVSAASPPPRRVGYAPLVTARAVSLGALAGTTAMRVDIELLPRDPAALANFATAVSTPGNPLYKHYIAPSEFANHVRADSGGDRERYQRTGVRRVAAGSNHGQSLDDSGDGLPRHSSKRHFRSALTTTESQAGSRTQTPKLLFSQAMWPPTCSGVVGLDNLYLPQRLGLRKPRGTVTAGARPQVVTGGPQPCSTAVADATGLGRLHSRPARVGLRLLEPVRRR